MAFMTVVGCVALRCSSLPAVAQTVDPAAAQVQVFYDTLLDSMRHAGEIKMQGRYEELYPVMLRVFDVPVMARMAIGTSFDQLPETQKSELITAFGKLLVATFASTFDDYKGETFSVDGDVRQRGADKFVKTTFHPNGAPVAINYLMRRRGDGWRVVDIYLNGTISQLATWRSQYGATLSSDGFPGVMAAVQSQTSKYMSAF